MADETVVQQTEAVAAEKEVMYRYLILCLISSLHSNITFKCCLLSLIVLCGIYPLSELAIQNLLQLKIN